MRPVPELTNLDARRAAIVESLCEAMVPGSTRVGPLIYIDACLTRMTASDRAAANAAIDALAEAASEGTETLRAHAGSADFLLVRALVVEAYYSDFVAPGLDEKGAWAEIDFNSPLAMRLRKDWSYLGASG
jgi:hypothetical protein